MYGNDVFDGICVARGSKQLKKKVKQDEEQRDLQIHDNILHFLNIHNNEGADNGEETGSKKHDNEDQKDMNR